MPRIMRSNYDKPRRCPDWSGPAWKDSDGECPGGMLNEWHEKKHPEWCFIKCTECGTLVLPNVLKWLDPSWLAWILKRKMGKW